MSAERLKQSTLSIHHTVSNEEINSYEWTFRLFSFRFDSFIRRWTYREYTGTQMPKYVEHWSLYWYSVSELSFLVLTHMSFISSEYSIQSQMKSDYWSRETMVSSTAGPTFLVADGLRVRWGVRNLKSEWREGWVHVISSWKTADIHAPAILFRSTRCF